MRTSEALSFFWAASIRWLGRNWEPITAVSALVVSIWTAISTYQGILAAEEAIKLAQEIQKLEKRNKLIERVPLVGLTHNYAMPSAAIVSMGNGPAYIYQIDLAFMDKRLKLKAGKDPTLESEAFKNFVNDALKPNTPDGIEVNFTYGTYTFLHGPNTTKTIINFQGGSAEQAELGRLFLTGLSIRLCYMDIVGEFRASYTSGDPATVNQAACDDATSFVRLPPL